EGFEGDGRALRGVHCTWRGEKIRIRARNVVLAAGALATPLLLLASGLGDGLPWVGRGLMRHAIDLYVLRNAEPVRSDADAKAVALNDFYWADGVKLGT